MDSSRYTHRNLVSEQPGLAILISGLALAFFFGLTLRSFISSARISPQVERVVSRLHPDIKVSFSSAEISLRHSIFPRFSVIIRDVVLRSENPCWGAPSLEANEIRLPLSISSLLSGGAPVNSVVVDQAQVWIKSGQSCPRGPSGKGSKTAAAVKASEPTEENNSAIKLSSEGYNNNPRDISKVEINRLRVSVSGYSQYTTEFQRLMVSAKNSEIELKARTLLKDSELGAEFSTFANLYVLFKDQPGAPVQAHVYGNWREGHYSVIGNYNIEDRTLTLESELKHIPAGGVLSVLKKYDLLSKDIQARQVWISFKAKGRGPVSSFREWPLEVRDVHMEGAVGELNVEGIQFLTLSPLRYQPIRVEVKKLDIGRLLNVVGEPVSTPILRDVGFFDGIVEIFSSEHVELKGVTNGLEFVFSNKGQRHFQALDGISGQARFKNQQWNIEIVNFTPRNGSFKGSVSLTADNDFDQIQIKTDIQELVLSPVVQTLMTGHERIGPLSMTGQSSMNKGRVVDLKGKAFMPFLEVEGIRFSDLAFTFGSQSGSIVIDPRFKEMQFMEQAPLTRAFQSMLKLEGKDLLFRNVAGRFISGKGLEWQDLNLDWGDLHLLTQGGWDDFGLLKGSIKMSESKKPLRLYRISGHRDSPQVTEVPK